MKREGSSNLPHIYPFLAHASYVIWLKLKKQKNSESRASLNLANASLWFLPKSDQGRKFCYE